MDGGGQAVGSNLDFSSLSQVENVSSLVSLKDKFLSMQFVPMKKDLGNPG